VKIKESGSQIRFRRFAMKKLLYITIEAKLNYSLSVFLHIIPQSEMTFILLGLLHIRRVIMTSNECKEHNLRQYVRLSVEEVNSWMSGEAD
jgi:hypothetical protein